jgi:hypothetical protein
MKLTPAEVVRMRTLRAEGQALRDLSKEFGICESYASLLVTGRKRRHVGGPITFRGAVQS